MRPPVWPDFPAGGAFDALYDIAPITAIEAARCNAEAIALSLNEVGINVDCLPVLDVRVPETHSAIGDRALGSEPLRVAALGRAILDGLALGGVIGVVKHMPGHGRALLDSLYALPTVTASAQELEEDLAPFRAASPWVEDWALFAALSGEHGPAWTRWPEALRERDPAALAAARDRFADQPLAVLYDRFSAPPPLAKAHSSLDRAVDRTFGISNGTEASRLSALFNRYEELARTDERRGKSA
jgi:hypothetical protein